MSKQTPVRRGLLFEGKKKMNNLWFKIGWAVLLGAMVVYMWPRAKAAMANSPKASTDDWKAVMIPIALVVLLVALLIYTVRK